MATLFKTLFSSFLFFIIQIQFEPLSRLGANDNDDQATTTQNAVTDRLRADVSTGGGVARLGAGSGDVPSCSPGKMYNNGSDSDGGGGRGGGSSAQQSSSLYKCSTMGRRRTPHFHEHLHHQLPSDFASHQPLGGVGGSILGIATMRSGQFSNGAGGGGGGVNELSMIMPAPQMTAVPWSSSNSSNGNKNNNNNNNNHVPILNSILTTTIAAQALQSSGGVSVVGGQASRSNNNNNNNTANPVGGNGNGTATLKKRVQIQEVTV